MNTFDKNEIVMHPLIKNENMISIFIFVLIISGNFLGELLPCKIQHILTNNMYVKHIFGILVFLFFGIISNPNNNNLKGIVNVFGIYFIFLLISKTHYIFWLIIVFCYGIMYLLDIIKHDVDTHDYNIVANISNNKLIKIINNTQKVLLYVGSIFTLLGLILYLGEKKMEYKNNFNYLLFLFGKNNCKNNPLKISSYIKLIKHAFSL